ncbi:MAG TPA: VOC family protein [Parcubacteria group bacterium]|jgi:predicted 3-demethylubiquinone-9 3-methyltransferase (glyoxalase superfamily)|nr:VOC family protein [Parcubacteria group bacterium]
MKKIIPHLWFDKEAKESAEFYVSVFPNSKIKNHSVIKGTPSGDCDIMSYDLGGEPFMSISAGPYFKINPSVSFMVNFDPSKDPNAKENLTKTWEKLVEGGKVMMELAEYPFSKWYGFCEDKYGVSWQLILTNPGGEDRPFIIPSLLFVGASYGKAETAVDYYLSVFKDSKLGTRVKYETDQGPNKAGTVMFSDFKLWETWFTAMDGGGEHKFAFNEAISFIVNCETQEEIDYFWEKLSAVPEAEQCGWLKDKFGVSWQIVPTRMNEMMGKGTPEQNKRVTEAFLKMKKFDIKKLEEAYNNQ